MKTKTSKATVETPDVEVSDVSVVTAEPVAEIHEAAVETSQHVVEMAADSAPTAPESKRTVRGVALKPVRVVYAAGRGTVHLIVGGTKAVGAKSMKVVRRTPQAGPVAAPVGDIKADSVDMAPEAPLHA